VYVFIKKHSIHPSSLCYSEYLITTRSDAYSQYVNMQYSINIQSIFEYSTTPLLLRLFRYCDSSCLLVCVRSLTCVVAKSLETAGSSVVNYTYIQSDRNSVLVSVTAPKLTYHMVSAWFRLRPKCTGANRQNAKTAETVKLARTVTLAVWQLCYWL